ncbi:response regulator transcription factor [Cellulosilyticum ruminicola]|uniref:response regulator transcription factor n=1 Tax=Cellulosilyticum ruminicola TaxID=425254 RepID=UPI0006D2BC03|nr:response regulator [Cellulosilyticum ruminicola]
MFKVQLVDDEPIVRKGLKELIPWEDLGFEVVCEAENGEEAIMQLKKREIDLTIVDIEMPIMTGMEFMAKVREDENDLEVIILTAYGEFEYAKSAIKYGALDYILKPLEEEKIILVLEKAKEKLMDKERNKKMLQVFTELKGEKRKKRQLSRDKDKQLVKYIMQSDERAFEILHNILEEERSYGDLERESMCVRFSYILEEIVVKIKERFIYLGKLENVDAYLDYGQDEQTEKEVLIDCFNKKISSLYSMFEESKVMYKDNIVMQACQYVIEHVDEEINLTIISEKLAISKNYFCTLFKQETGENFLSYVTGMKMKRAKFLLKEKKLSCL